MVNLTARPAFSIDPAEQRRFDANDAAAERATVFADAVTSGEAGPVTSDCSTFDGLDRIPY